LASPPTTKRPQPAASAEAKVLISDRGVVLPVENADPAGYRVGTPCGRTAVATGTPVSGATVVVDPGHGGDELGAVGPNGLTEKEVNLSVALHTAARLEAEGITVALTRGADYRVTLETRAKIALSLQPRAFVSIHHNSEPDGPWPKPGTETYYQVASGPSKRLAGIVYEEVVRALSGHPVAWVADRDTGAKYRKNSRGDDYYAVLRQTHGVPGVLAELAFISNPPEAELLARPEVQRAEGEAVARAVARYLRTMDQGSGFVEPYPRDAPAGPGGGAGGCVDPAL
jgi:N-acetylmuramoyl-L-alanine amidase